MFSFRTTPLEDQLDRTLHEGKVGCFCTQNCWDTGRTRWMYDISATGATWKWSSRPAMPS